MQRYEKYKDSGVDWIGEIPESWEICKLKFLGNIYAGINGKKGDDFSKEYSEGIKSFIPFTNICNNIKIDETKYQFVKIDEKENQNRVQKNDILFLMSSETLDDIAKNSIYLGDDDELYLNSFCKGFRISDSNVFPEFINYLFLSGSYRSYFSLVGRGFTRINLKQEFINDVYTLLPSYSEQQTIANFLDDKTAKIDQTIAIKQKEIELLKERRQILIQKAVTKGLDDTVKLKDSGVDWIGEIPEHWEVRKLKYCLNSKLKYGANESGVEYDLDLPRYIRITDFGFDGKLSEDKKLSLTWLQGKDYLLKDGNILFARSGATVGKSYQFKTSMSFEKHYSFAGYLIKAEANEEIILSDYLYLYTNSNLFDNWKSAIFNKATIENIGADKYSTLSVVVPPVIEQKEILLEYNTKNEKIAKAISIKEQEIEKLKEYKTVLIDQVVTGKVRVS